jgi:protein involved in polysaccharide export with SLBB domain
MGLAALAAPTSGQSVRVNGTRGLEERATLEAEARTAEAQHREGEAWLLRNRLQRGDFQEGDRIFVKLLGSIPFNDTITVRAGKILPLPQMDALSLDGVLRSELTGRLSSHLAKFLRDSSVQATPLLRLAVLGAVRLPGYYYTPADVLLSDVIMKAGGPAGADLGKMVIRRGSETIWNARDTQTALSDGLSLDRLHLRAGDELYLPAEGGGLNWLLVLELTATIASLLFAFTRFR